MPAPMLVVISAPDGCRRWISACMSDNAGEPDRRLSLVCDKGDKSRHLFKGTYSGTASPDSGDLNRPAIKMTDFQHVVVIG